MDRGRHPPPRAAGFAAVSQGPGGQARTITVPAGRYGSRCPPPADDGRHMLIARGTGTSRGHCPAGCGRAPPATTGAAGEFGPLVARPPGSGQAGVPQVRVTGGQPLLTFTCRPQEQSKRHRAGGVCSAWTVPGGTVTCPRRGGQAGPSRGEPTLCAAPLTQQRGGAGPAPASAPRDPEGIFSSASPGPIPLALPRGAPAVRTDVRSGG